MIGVAWQGSPMFIMATGGRGGRVEHDGESIPLGAPTGDEAGEHGYHVLWADGARKPAGVSGGDRRRTFLAARDQ